MNAVTHLEKVIVGEVSAVTHLEKVIAGETSAVTYTEKVITGEAPAVTHLQKVIAGKASPVTHLEHIWAGGSPTPTEHEYTGAVPVTFTADGTPLLDLLISGNMVQTVTPTSTTPIQPQECGERTGNLFLSNWEQGVIDSSGMNIPSANGVRTKNYIPVTPNTIYSISRNIATNYINLRFYNSNKQYINYGTSSNIRLISGNSAGNPMAAGMGFCCFEIIDTNIKYMRINDNSNDTSTKYMMVEGQYTASTMPSYEPYGYKIQISSASTTTPVYLGEVETTRKIRKYECTGDESWSVTSGQGKTRAVANFTTSIEIVPLSKVVSTHYIGVEGGTGYPDINTITVNNSGTIIIGISSEYTNANAFKAYLTQQYAAGTPVTVWYVLATEETGIVNEPIRKIGDYADTLSMEQAGVSIPTNNGSTTVDVATTLKPSEVYIKYKGV